MAPEEASSFSSENIGSVPTGQTVGIEVISFLAIGMFPQLFIGKFQTVGISVSCALDQITHREHFSFPLRLQSPYSDLCAPLAKGAPPAPAHPALKTLPTNAAQEPVVASQAL